MTTDDRQPWELGDDESGSPRKEVSPTSEPLEEEERGKAGERPAKNGEPDWNHEDAPAERSHSDEEDLGAGSQYAAEDAHGHSEPKGPAGGAAGPR